MPKPESARDDEKFMQHLTNCQRDLRAFILGMTPTKSDADDVLQEVNLAIWKKRHLYDPGQSFIRWAFGFAAMEIRSYRNRKSKKHLWFNDEVLETIAESWPSDTSVMEQQRDALTDCVKKLGSIEQKLINGFYGSQYTAQELAESSGKPLSTVYKILSRARRALRVCVQRTLARQTRPT